RHAFRLFDELAAASIRGWNQVPVSFWRPIPGTRVINAQVTHVEMHLDIVGGKGVANHFYYRRPRQMNVRCRQLRSVTHGRSLRNPKGPDLDENILLQRVGAHGRKVRQPETERIVK